MTSKPLRVLQILPRLEVGGVERGTLEWAHALKKMGHVPFVVSGGGQGAQWLKQAGIQHFTMPVGRKRFSSLRLVKPLRALMIELGVDVVHARSRFPAWLAHWAIKKINPKPAFVTTLHGLHTVSPYASIMAKGDRVIAVSETASDYLETHFAKHLKAKPVVIHRGIDERVFPYQAQVDPLWAEKVFSERPDFRNRFKILLPGRMTAVKGGLELLDWLCTCDDGMVLMVNGKPEDSHYTKAFNQKARSAGVESRIMWLGVERDMVSLYACADVVLSVNQKPESFGRTVLEALTIGRPVVAYDHGGVGEIMRALFPQGLVPANDLDRLGALIKAFKNNPPIVPQHGQFRLAHQFEKTMSVYQELLQSRQQEGVS